MPITLVDLDSNESTILTYPTANVILSIMDMDGTSDVTVKFTLTDPHTITIERIN